MGDCVVRGLSREPITLSRLTGMWTKQTDLLQQGEQRPMHFPPHFRPHSGKRQCDESGLLLFEEQIHWKAQDFHSDANESMGLEIRELRTPWE